MINTVWLQNVGQIYIVHYSCHFLIYIPGIVGTDSNIFSRPSFTKVWSWHLSFDKYGWYHFSPWSFTIPMWIVIVTLCQCIDCSSNLMRNAWIFRIISVQVKSNKIIFKRVNSIMVMMEVIMMINNAWKNAVGKGNNIR